MPVGSGSVVARNFMDGITTMSSDIKGSVSVEWGAMDDPEGNDVQYVPTELAESVAFKRALARGVIGLIAEESDPEVVEALSKQVSAFQRRQAGAQDTVQSTIDRPTSRDSLSVFCVGPDSRGTGTCGEPIAVPEQKLNDEPPLCTRHKGLAAQYVPEHEVSLEETGKPSVRWNRVTLTARETAPRV